MTKRKVLYLSARFCDPDRFLVVGVDQRGCGSSLPDAGDPATDLAVNTTAHLIDDLEAVRAHLGVDRWLLGGSGGSTLAFLASGLGLSPRILSRSAV